MIDDDELVTALKADYRKAEISVADRAMLDYTAKLTRTPWEMHVGDVESLRRVGFEDAAILDINQVTGYYAFANRLVDGLGVNLENFWEHKDKGS